MAIAAILSGVTSEDDALAVIEPIIEFDGLGESAFGMLLLLHDSAAALKESIIDSRTGIGFSHQVSSDDQ